LAPARGAGACPSGGAPGGAGAGGVYVGRRAGRQVARLTGAAAVASGLDEAPAARGVSEGPPAAEGC